MSISIMMMVNSSFSSLRYHTGPTASEGVKEGGDLVMYRDACYAITLRWAEYDFFASDRLGVIKDSL